MNNNERPAGTAVENSTTDEANNVNPQLQQCNVSSSALSWWQQFKTTEKSAIFRKYFSSGVTCLIDLTQENINTMYVSEHCS